MGRKLRANGFWLFAQWLRRELRRQAGGRRSLAEGEGAGMKDFVPVAAHYWPQLDKEVKRQWKRQAKAYSKTPEFKALQRRHRRLHANSPSRRRPRRRGGGGGTRGPDEEAPETDPEEEEPWIGPQGEILIGQLDSDGEDEGCCLDGLPVFEDPEEEEPPALAALLDQLETDSAFGSMLSLDELQLNSAEEEEEEEEEEETAPLETEEEKEKGKEAKEESAQLKARSDEKVTTAVVAESQAPPPGEFELRCPHPKPALLITGFPTIPAKAAAAAQVNWASAVGLKAGPPPGCFRPQPPALKTAPMGPSPLTSLAPPPGVFRQASVSPPSSPETDAPPQPPPPQPPPPPSWAAIAARNLGK